MVGLLFHIPVLWIRDVYPGSEFFPSRIPDPGSKRFPDPHPHPKNLEFKYFNPKNCFQILGNMIQNVQSGSGSWFFTHLGSRIQGTKSHRNPDRGFGSAALLYTRSSYRHYIPRLLWVRFDDGEGESCARVDSVLVKKDGSRSHLRITSVHNVTGILVLHL